MILPTSWGQQPQAPVGINRANPLTSGMLVLVHPAQGSAPRDVNVGLTAFAPQNGTAAKAGAGGIGWNVATAASDGLQAVASSPGFPVSIGVVFVPGTLAASANLACYANSSVVNTRSRIGLRIDTGGTTVGAYSMGATGTLGEDVATNAVQVGRANVALGVFASTSGRKVFLNGVAGAGSATGSVPTSVDSLCVGSGAASTRQNGQVGQYQLFIVWNRALSDAEAREFSRDPWQVFQQAPKVRAFDVVANVIAADTAESLAAADSPAASVVFAASTAESLSAADACDATVIRAAAVAESASATDAPSALLVRTGSVAETASAADSASAAATFAATVGETLSASDATASGGSTIAASVAETASATDTHTAAATLAASLAETLTAADAPSAAAVFSAATAEAGSAADASNWGGQILSASVAEAASAGDTLSASAVLTAPTQEYATADDIVSASFIAAAVLTETSAAVDITTGQWITSADVAEAGAAADNTDGALASAPDARQYPLAGMTQALPLAGQAQDYPLAGQQQTYPLGS